VAELARFYGIIMAFFPRDHGVPHVHARYAGDVASIRIDDGKVLKGHLPGPALGHARRWISLHRAELLAGWIDWRAGRTPGKIAPLR
jgi:uncharacterized protein DUF4160